MRIVFVGAGNVATHLAKKIDESQDVVQVYSYHYENAYALAKTLKNAQPINDLAQLVSDADVYILSVKDDVLADVSDKINFTSGLWLHTSGSVSIELLKKRFPKCGVLYPLQTFSKGSRATRILETSALRLPQSRPTLSQSIFMDVGASVLI